ncbi:hypothetical protein [Tunicatimonas pelagia]|uniref:hypothetical protein n=1 Tax=Tunicatimonas pelagia TaxID=931531 RepID=UPI002666E3DE|nr:hypothetical protein [Tunicatimonas pelagia]WKN42514.1 hypothetical protein P0M28_26110 [Tunicatimonas pelagia]
MVALPNQRIRATPDSLLGRITKPLDSLGISTEPLSPLQPAFPKASSQVPALPFAAKQPQLNQIVPNTPDLLNPVTEQTASIKKSASLAP